MQQYIICVTYDARYNIKHNIRKKTAKYRGQLNYEYT